VNLGPNRLERIVVFDGDSAVTLAEEFAMKNGLDGNMKIKLT
jgi:hypothetical protein